MKCSEFLHDLTNYLDGVLDDRTKAELEDRLRSAIVSKCQAKKKVGPQEV